MLESPLRVLWNTKYFPSVVHLPQHSCAGTFQPGDRSGCGFVPSERASHSEDTPPPFGPPAFSAPVSSATVKRMRDPSGERLIPLGLPATVRILRSSRPSSSARNISRPLDN